MRWGRGWELGNNSGGVSKPDLLLSQQRDISLFILSEMHVSGFWSCLHNFASGWSDYFVKINWSVVQNKVSLHRSAEHGLLDIMVRATLIFCFMWLVLANEWKLFKCQQLKSSCKVLHMWSTECVVYLNLSPLWFWLMETVLFEGFDTRGPW